MHSRSELEAMTLKKLRNLGEYLNSSGYNIQLHLGKEGIIEEILNAFVVNLEEDVSPCSVRIQRIRNSTKKGV